MHTETEHASFISKFLLLQAGQYLLAGCRTLLTVRILFQGRRIYILVGAIKETHLVSFGRIFQLWNVETFIVMVNEFIERVPYELF